MILEKSHIGKKRASEEEQFHSFDHSKKDSLSSLAGSIAHELNNPLAIVTGKLEILESSGNLLEWGSGSYLPCGRSGDCFCVGSKFEIPES